MVIPKLDAPATGGQPWYGLVRLRSVSARRTEIIGWSEILEPPPPSPAGAVILLSTSMPFEFPTTVNDLLD